MTKQQLVESLKHLDDDALVFVALHEKFADIIYGVDSVDIYCNYAQFNVAEYPWNARASDG